MASYVGNKPLFGNFDKLDDISSSFNGSANTFAMTSNSRGVTAGDETQVVISLNGVIQEPVTDYFLATTGQIQFTTAPASGTAFFGYVTGNIGGTASTITDGIVTTAKLANTAGTGSAVQLAANTSTLTIAANGNIGIGTTSPAAKTEVVVSSGENIRLTKATGAYLGFHDSTQTRASLQGINGADGLTFHTGSAITERMRINGSGKVGIGTTNPWSQLDVSAGTGSAFTSLTADNNKTIYFRHSDGTLHSQIESQSTGSMWLTTRTAGSIIQFGINNSEQVRIDSNGNVGIGTASPTEDLHIKGKDSAHADVIIQAYTGYNSGLNFNDNAGMAGRVYYNHSNNFMAFDVNGSEAARIDNTGQLIIGHDGSGSPYFNEGIVLNPGSDSIFHRDGGSVVDFSRETSDGQIVRFVKDNSVVGSIGAGGGNVIVNSASNYGILQNAGSNQYVWSNSAGAGAFYPEADNSKDLGLSSKRFQDLYLSGGVYVGGTGSANHLDDYEEGTWSANDISGVGLSVTTNRAWYVKTGSLVTISASVQFPTTTNTTAIELAIPFTSNIQSYYAAEGSIGYTNVTATLAEKHIRPIIENGGSDVLFYYSNGTRLNYSEVSGRRLDFTISYQRT